MKKIIKHHVGHNNIIISEGQEAYSWLRYDNYEHRVYINGRHDLGWGSESTSHIEQVWATFKRYIAKLYTTLNQKNFIYYVREIEFHYNARKKKIKLVKLLNYKVF